MTNQHEGEKRSGIRRRSYLLATLVGSAALIGSAFVGVENFATKQSAELHPHKNDFEARPSWVQDFAHMHDTRVDPGIWHYDTNYLVPGYNDEEQAYTNLNRNVRIEPGTGLVIEAHRDAYIYPDDPTKRAFNYTSGRIDTLNAFDFEYGKVEARMRLPKGVGTWPAFWLLSANEIHTDGAVQSPNDSRAYTKNGEIDIMEHYGSAPGVLEATVHTYAQSYAGQSLQPDVSENFHTYGVEVTPTNITWTIDGNPYHSFDKRSADTNEWPFGNGNRLYVIFNLAMGGTGGGEITDKRDSWKMEIQNLSFYEYNPE